VDGRGQIVIRTVEQRLAGLSAHARDVGDEGLRHLSDDRRHVVGGAVGVEVIAAQHPPRRDRGEVEVPNVLGNEFIPEHGRSGEALGRGRACVFPILSHRHSRVPDCGRGRKGEESKYCSFELQIVR